MEQYIPREHTHHLGVTLDRTLSYKEQHKYEGAHPKQPPEEVIKLQIGL